MLPPACRASTPALAWLVLRPYAPTLSPYIYFAKPWFSAQVGPLPQLCAKPGFYKKLSQDGGGIRPGLVGYKSGRNGRTWQAYMCGCVSGCQAIALVLQQSCPPTWPPTLSYSVGAKQGPPLRRRVLMCDPKSLRRQVAPCSIVGPPTPRRRVAPLLHVNAWPCRALGILRRHNAAATTLSSARHWLACPPVIHGELRRCGGAKRKA